MYRKEAIDRLVSFINDYNGIGDKEKLTKLVVDEFSLNKHGKSLYYNEDFAIRFGFNGKNDEKYASNTVLSLKNIIRFDNRPIIFCLVTHNQNYLMLMNTSLLNKISHSSQKLTITCIRGSILGTDILKNFAGLTNEPANFEKIFSTHQEIDLNDNIERLVEETDNIKGTMAKFEVNDLTRSKIISSINRTIEFINSPEYLDLYNDLNNRVNNAKEYIRLAADIDNVKIRGNVVEVLITDDEGTIRKRLINAFNHKRPLPKFKVEDKLGDYHSSYPGYYVETDIKSKVLTLSGNPKAYNIDKFLEFLASDKAVYLIYVLGINTDGEHVARLVSPLDKRLIEWTRIQNLWAGRKRRGVAMFISNGLEEVIHDDIKSLIDVDKAINYLDELIKL